MGFPAFFDHRPVGVITIHGDVLPPAAGGNARIEGIISNFGQKSLERHHIFQRTGFRHVTPVEQYVNAHALDSLRLGLQHHGFQVVDMAMHIAV